MSKAINWLLFLRAVLNSLLLNEDIKDKNMDGIKDISFCGEIVL
jgi:hypothetical protein